MCLRLLSYYNENFGPDRSDRSVSVQPNQSIGPVWSVQALNSINRSRSGLNLRDNRSGSVGPSLLSLDRLDRTRTGPDRGCPSLEPTFLSFSVFKTCWIVVFAVHLPGCHDVEYVQLHRFFEGRMIGR